MLKFRKSLESEDNFSAIYESDLVAADPQSDIAYLVQYSDGTRCGPYASRSEAESDADRTDGLVIELAGSADDPADEGKESDA